MRELRVAHVVPARFGTDGVVGGAERYALELARAMAARVPTKLVTFGEHATTERDGPLEIVVLGPARAVRGQSQNPLAPGLFAALSSATVIHCHQQHVLASSLAAAYARLTRRRVFVSDLGGGGWDVSGYVSTDRWYHGHLHISEYSRRVFGHERNPRATVILGGVDTHRFSPDASVPKRDYVLFVGRLLPHKGIHDLISAMPPDVPLHVIGHEGDPAYVDVLRRLAEDKWVVFRREVDDQSLVRAYRESACTILPSVYRSSYGQETRIPELLGQTLLEAMACGVPGIATDVASLPEVIEPGRSGLLVPPNDPPALGAAIAQLAGNPDKARAMGDAARRRILERFTWDAVVDRCLAAYGVDA